jgi:hypothetical protein
MRSILALSLLITLGASANAATVHHAHHRHAVVPSNQGLVSDPASSFGYAPARPPVYQQPAPAYSDQPDPTVDWPYRNWGG